MWFALLAALGGGSQLVSLDRAAEHDALFAVLLMRGTSVAIFTVAGLIVRPAVARETLPLLALIGILDTTAVVLFAAAAAEGLLSVLAVLACLYPVVTVGLARVRLGERLAGAQAAGVGLAFAGILLVTGGSGGSAGREALGGQRAGATAGENPALVSSREWSRPAASVKDSWSLQTVTPVARCLFGRFRPAPAARVSLPAKLSFMGACIRVSTFSVASVSFVRCRAPAANWPDLPGVRPLPSR